MKIKINRLINVTFGSRKTCVSTVRVTKTSLLLILTIIFDILWIKLETNIFRLNDEGGNNQNHSFKWIYN